MHSSIKIFITFSLITLCSLGSIFATNNDCGLVATTTDVTDAKNYTKLKDIISVRDTLNYATAIPQDFLAKSFENLKKYCCQNNLIGNEFCLDFKDNTNYPESPYLYDHLIDVGFRRLDGRADLAYGLPPDAQGKEWRDFITKSAEEKDGTTAKTIIEKYKEYWTGRIILPGDKTKFINNYNDITQVSLKDKYSNLCTIMKEVYNKVAEQKIVIGEYKNSFLAQCQKLANRRISDEYLYTKVLLSKKSNELLHTTTQAYIQKYFIQDKMSVLITTINKIKALFTSMVQGAAASRSCSK